MAIRDFILLSVNSVETAKAYITALVANDCSFDTTADVKEFVPHLFSQEEALIVTDRVKSMHEHLDELHDNGPGRYMEIAVCRRMWAGTDEEHRQNALVLFDRDNNDATIGDMVALLEWNEPNGDFEDLSFGELVTLMEHFK